MAGKNEIYGILKTLKKLRKEYVGLIAGTKDRRKKKRMLRYRIGKAMVLHHISAYHIYKTLKNHSSTKIQIGGASWWHGCINIYECYAQFAEMDPVRNQLNKMGDIFIIMLSHKEHSELVKHFAELFTSEHKMNYKELLSYCQHLTLSKIQNGNTALIPSIEGKEETTGNEISKVQEFYLELLDEEKEVKEHLSKLQTRKEELIIAISTIQSLLQRYGDEKIVDYDPNVPEPGIADVLTLR